MMNPAMHSSNKIFLLLLQQQHQWALWGNSMGTKVFVYWFVASMFRELQACYLHFGESYNLHVLESKENI